VLLGELTELIDINVTFESNGRVRLFNNKGDLLSENRFHLEYDSKDNIQELISGSAFDSIKMTLLNSDGSLSNDSQELVAGGVPSGTAFASELESGKLNGLLKIRDETIPRMLQQLDQFSATFRNEFNRIHNKGSGFPPPQSLTGTTILNQTDEHQFTGDVLIAPLGADGRPVASPWPSEPNLRPFTLDFATIQGPTGQGSATIVDIQREINAYFTPSQRAQIAVPNGGTMTDLKLGAISNTVAADGTFQFDLDIDNGSDAAINVVVTGISSPDAGIGFTAIPASLVAGITVQPGERLRTGIGSDFTADFAAAVGAPPHTIELAVEVDGVAGVIQYTVDENLSEIRNNRISATGVGGGAAVLEAPVTSNAPLRAELLDADGNPAVGGEPARLQLIGDATTRVVVDELDSVESGRISPTVASLTGRGFSHFFGLNNFFDSNNDTLTNGALNLEVESRIVNNPSLLAAGRLAASVSLDGTPVYTQELSIASAQNIIDINAMQNSLLNFDAAGSLPGLTLTAGGYISELLGFAALATSSATDRLEKENLIFDGLSERLKGVTGVNIDEELANSIFFQNAFQASSRMISVIDELFDSLINNT
jgi:flagellar hook-associated protein 1 FlgK